MSHGHGHIDLSADRSAHANAPREENLSVRWSATCSPAALLVAVLDLLQGSCCEPQNPHVFVSNMFLACMILPLSINQAKMKLFFDVTRCLRPALTGQPMGLKGTSRSASHSSVDRVSMTSSHHLLHDLFRLLNGLLQMMTISVPGHHLCMKQTRYVFMGVALAL